MKEQVHTVLSESIPIIFFYFDINHSKKSGDRLPGNRPERAMQIMTRPLAKMNPNAVANVAGMDIWYRCNVNRVVPLFSVSYLFIGRY